MSLEQKRETEINAMRKLFKDNKWIEEDRQNQLEIMKQLKEEIELDILEKRARFTAYMKNPVRCNPNFEFEKSDKEYLEVIKKVDGYKLQKVIKETEDKMLMYEARLDFLNSQECIDIIKENTEFKKQSGDDDE